MMDWQFIFTTINSIVLIVTVIILITQTWILRKQVLILQDQTKAAIEASSAVSHAHLNEIIFKIDDIFLEKPHLRKYFYQGVPIDENSPLYDEAESAAEELLDLLELMLWQSTLFPKLYVHEQGGKKIWEEMHQYFIDLLVSCPLLMMYVEKKRSWFSPQVIECMEEAKRIHNQRNNASSS